MMRMALVLSALISLVGCSAKPYDAGNSLLWPKGQSTHYRLGAIQVVLHQEKASSFFPDASGLESIYRKKLEASLLERGVLGGEGNSVAELSCKIDYERGFAWSSDKGIAKIAVSHNCSISRNGAVVATNVLGPYQPFRGQMGDFARNLKVAALQLDAAEEEIDIGFMAKAMIRDLP